VGRAEELAEIEALVAAGEGLVTLLGAPGVGKSRLAREFVARWGRRAAEPVPIRCDFTEARSREAVIGCFAVALAVPRGEGADEERMLHAATHALSIRGGILVVLDDVEHVVEHVAELVERLRERPAPSRFLVTSRQPLGIADEIRCEIGP